MDPDAFARSAATPILITTRRWSIPRRGLKDDLSDDGLHPNSKGYRIMAPLALEAVTRTLKPHAAAAAAPVTTPAAAKKKK